MTRRLAVLLVILGVGCDPSAPPPGPAQQRGPRAVQPAPAIRPGAVHEVTPAKAPVRPPPATTPHTTAATKAPATDGGPADGGAPAPRPRDMSLERAVESRSRELASCFPSSLAQPPGVTVDFQISVTGYVTRAEVSTPGVDRSIRDCVSRSARAVRFPAGEKSRDFRYELRLRRADAGTPVAR